MVSSFTLNTRFMKNKERVRISVKDERARLWKAGIHEITLNGFKDKASVLTYLDYSKVFKIGENEYEVI